MQGDIINVISYTCNLCCEKAYYRECVCVSVCDGGVQNPHLEILYMDINCLNSIFQEVLIQIIKRI